jgi:murein endopeptidase
MVDGSTVWWFKTSKVVQAVAVVNTKQAQPATCSEITSK